MGVMRAWECCAPPQALAPPLPRAGHIRPVGAERVGQKPPPESWGPRELGSRCGEQP